jgi:hypothetical protein
MCDITINGPSNELEDVSKNKTIHINVAENERLSLYYREGSLMHLALTCLFSFLPWTGVLASGQVPIVDGVIGGVPGPESHFSQLLEASTLANVTTTPGKLRVVENSGICGPRFLNPL